MNHDTPIKRTTQTAADEDTNRVGSFSKRLDDLSQETPSSPSHPSTAPSDRIGPVLERAAQRVDASLHSASDKAREVVLRSNRSASGYLQSCESFVIDRPISAIALAAVSGAAITAFVLTLAR